MPKTPTALLGAAGAIVVIATGCGGGDSASQPELEQARHQGAAAARRTAAIRELHKEVASLKRSDSRTPETAVPPHSEGTVNDGDVGRVPASGTYYGQAEQRGERVSINKDYPIDMTFSSAGSTVDYPTLDCHGSLRPLGFDGPYRVYEETIISGHCDSGGTWRVYVEGDSRLDATWSLSSVDYSVSAVLLS